MAWCPCSRYGKCRTGLEYWTIALSPRGWGVGEPQEAPKKLWDLNHFYSECLGSLVAEWLGTVKMVESSNPDPGMILPSTNKTQNKVMASQLQLDILDLSKASQLC